MNITNQSRALYVIRSSTLSLTCGQIAERAGMDPKVCSRALENLRLAGLAQASGRGRYATWTAEPGPIDEEAAPRWDMFKAFAQAVAA